MTDLHCLLITWCRPQGDCAECRWPSFGRLFWQSPSLCGPVSGLTVIVFVVAANQPCANVGSWSLPKSQRGVSPSERVWPPGRFVPFLEVLTDFKFCVTTDDNRFVIGYGLWWWHWITITVMCLIPWYRNHSRAMISLFPIRRCHTFRPPILPEWPSIAQYFL
jgi:hypothetical protein